MMRRVRGLDIDLTYDRPLQQIIDARPTVLTRPVGCIVAAATLWKRFGSQAWRFVTDYVGVIPSNPEAFQYAYPVEWS